MPFLTDTITYFSENNDLLGVRFDSVKITGNDTSYISYHVFDDTSQSGYGYCVISSKGMSWIGFGMKKKSDGNYLFSNYNDDTILVRSNAILNEAWKFVELDDTTYLEATVNSIDLLNFNCFVDSVKIIGFSKRNLNGDLLPSEWNGKQIWLSKKMGL
jgi:hypothetical protein